MNTIPDFSKEEIKLVAETLFERYGKATEIKLADTELRLDQQSTEMTLCPTIYWQAGDCHFTLSKMAKMRFHGQFYYRGYQQYGTGREYYDDLFECVVALLHAQADDALKKGLS